MGLAVSVYGVSSNGDIFYLIISFGSLVQLMACMPIERLVPNSKNISDLYKVPVQLYFLFLFLFCNSIILALFLLTFLIEITEVGRLSWGFPETLTTMLYGASLTNLHLRMGIHQFHKRFLIATSTAIISPFAIFLFLILDLYTASFGPIKVLFFSSILSLVFGFFYPKIPTLYFSIKHFKKQYLIFFKSVVSSSFLKLSHGIYHFSLTWFVNFLGISSSEGGVMLLNIAKRAAEAVTQIAVAPSIRRLLVYISEMPFNAEIRKFVVDFYSSTISYFILIGIIASITLSGYIFYIEGSKASINVLIYFIAFIMCQILILIETPYSTINNVNSNIKIFFIANIFFALSLLIFTTKINAINYALFGILIPQTVILYLHYNAANRERK